MVEAGKQLRYVVDVTPRTSCSRRTASGCTRW